MVQTESDPEFDGSVSIRLDEHRVALQASGRDLQRPSAIIKVACKVHPVVLRWRSLEARISVTGVRREAGDSAYAQAPQGGLNILARSF